MKRNHPALAAVLVAFIGLVLACPALGQEWAAKMFEATDHNFGNVARGAKTQFRFQFYNPNQQVVHIESMNSDSPSLSAAIDQSIVHDVRGTIIVRLNTDDYTGNQTGTIEVKIDKPSPATVKLGVSGNIRPDLLVQGDSGAVDFGTVYEGKTRERKISVMKYNSPNWAINDVRSANRSYEVEVHRKPSRDDWTIFEVTARINGDAIPGKLVDPLVIVTNDTQVPRFPIEVEGEVIPLPPSSGR